ncbi:uncharacterized protein TrAtP1_004141 [Trichoderma atroviride]|uniref:uncharacterized protein n=1 Tax=Hypocrea atroviridis TaxID=63577 RepID=UPI003330E415|nr:hypothetical protein TrAtP1_004141 [Trichoderma atroviride]
MFPSCLELTYTLVPPLSIRARPSNSRCPIRSQQFLYSILSTTQTLSVFTSPALPLNALLHLSHPASRLSSSSASFLVACRMNRFGDANAPHPQEKKKVQDDPRASLHHKGLGVLIFFHHSLLGFLVPG